MKRQEADSATKDQADRSGLYLAPGVITIGSKVKPARGGETPKVAKQDDGTKQKSVEVKQKLTEAKPNHGVKQNHQQVNSKKKVTPKPQRVTPTPPRAKPKPPRAKSKQGIKPQAPIDNQNGGVKETTNTVNQSVSKRKQQPSNNKGVTKKNKTQQAKKPKRNMSKFKPLGEGFKVLLSVGNDFSLQGTMVSVIQDNKLIAQQQMDENGVVVFHQINTPLMYPVKVIVQFPSDQNLEDLHFSVDAGDTGLSAQV